MSSIWPSNPTLLYQPIALYWEQGQPELRPAAEAACRQLAQWQERRGDSFGPPDLARPADLEALPRPVPDLLEEASLLLERGARVALPMLFPDLLAYHQRLLGQIRTFASLYPNHTDLLQALQGDLTDYQDAVGALVEEAWSDAGRLVTGVIRNLSRHLAAMEDVRLKEGFSAAAELDYLAWTLQAGRPDGASALEKLKDAEFQVLEVLAHEFPDPRLGSEWADLWAPLCQELKGRLASRPDFSLLPRLEEFFQRQQHWLQRARQRRDYSRLSWWQVLRQSLVDWYAGCKLRASVLEALKSSRLRQSTDFSDWPEADRELRQGYAQQANHWLGQIEGCLRDSARHQLGELVAFGDWRFDRWLWLAQPKA